MYLSRCVDVAFSVAEFDACVRCLIAVDAFCLHVIEPIYTVDADATAAATACVV